MGVVSVRLSTVEERRLEREACQSKMSTSELIRRKLFTPQAKDSSTNIGGLQTQAESMIINLLQDMLTQTKINGTILSQNHLLLSPQNGKKTIEKIVAFYRKQKGETNHE